MLEGLRHALDQTGFAWAFAGWSEAPKTDYGVYSLSGQVQFRGDGDSGSEIMLRGYVDYFTHDRTRSAQKAIENALRSIRLWWNLESIQFEPETGFIHYEWAWADTEGKAEMCRILFVEHGRTIERYVFRGDIPEEPERDGYEDTNGLWYVRTNWDAEITAANGDTTYTAEYHPFGYAVASGSVTYIYNGRTPNEHGVPRYTKAWTNETLEAFRERTRVDGERGKVVYRNDMTQYNRIYGLSIRATGTTGTLVDGMSLLDVDFKVN